MRLPRVTGRQVIRALGRLGFEVERIRGSHYQMVHISDPTRQATVPVHGSRNLHPRIIHSILRSSKVTRQELAEHL